MKQPGDIIMEVLEEIMGIKIPVVRMSKSEREEVDEFLEELSELASFIEHDEGVQEEITLIAETLLLKEEIKATVLETTAIDIALILKCLVSRVKYPDQKDVQKLLTEYLNEEEPTHRGLAQKMLDDIDFILKTKSISSNIF